MSSRVVPSAPCRSNPVRSSVRNLQVTLDFSYSQLHCDPDTAASDISSASTTAKVLEHSIFSPSRRHYRGRLFNYLPMGSSRGNRLTCTLNYVFQYHKLNIFELCFAPFWHTFTLEPPLTPNELSGVVVLSIFFSSRCKTRKRNRNDETQKSWPMGKEHDFQIFHQTIAALLFHFSLEYIHCFFPSIALHLRH